MSAGIANLTSALGQYDSDAVRDLEARDTHNAGLMLLRNPVRKFRVECKSIVGLSRGRAPSCLSRRCEYDVDGETSGSTQLPLFTDLLAAQNNQHSQRHLIQ